MVVDSNPVLATRLEPRQLSDERVRAAAYGDDDRIAFEFHSLAGRYRVPPSGGVDSPSFIIDMAALVTLPP